MGASNSTIISEQVTDTVKNTINETIIRLAQTCASAIVTNQNIELGNIKNSTIDSIHQAASSSINMTCLQSSKNDSELHAQLVDELSNKMDQAAQANPTIANANISTAVGSTFNKLVQNLANSVSIDSVKSCASSTTNNQSLKTGDIEGVDINAIDQQITSESILNCIQNDSNISKMTGQLATYVENATKQTASSGMDITFWIVLVLGILIVLYLVRKLL